MCDFAHVILFLFSLPSRIRTYYVMSVCKTRVCSCSSARGTSCAPGLSTGYQTKRLVAIAVGLSIVEVDSPKGVPQARRKLISYEHLLNTLHENSC